MNTSIRPLNRLSALVLLVAGLGALCAAGGCRSLPRSGLDPYGERLFESCPISGWRPSDCNLFGQRNADPTTAPTLGATPIPTPVDSQASVFSGTTPTPAPSPASSALLPGSLGAAQTGSSGMPPYGSTATATAPGTRGVNTALIHSPDAGPKPVFEETGGYALPTAPIEGPAILMTPREQIAPVGSEVVLISSYLGKKDRLITNEKIEWSLEGVGSIMKHDPGSCRDPLHFDYVRAKKVSDRYAVTKTSQTYQHLDRGTPETKDDIHLLRGQTWVSVNSMREGTTHVSAFAPALKDWSKRTDFGIIHWVDAQWVLPRLSIAPVGESRLLTTTVLQRTNGQPRRGWIVRYEILNGPAAGFGASMSQIEEVETDLSGQASIFLSQREPLTGTNTISIRIVRPAGVDGSERRVTVGDETVRQTWSGAPGVRIRIQGPPTASIGRDIPYTITVSNPTGTTAEGVVALTLPPVVSHIGSNPPASQNGAVLQWNVAVPPHATETIQLVLKQDGAGKMLLNAQFYPRGIVPPPTGTSSGGPPVYGTSVPTPEQSGSLAVVRPAPADIGSTVPTLPHDSATLFGGSSSPTSSGSGGATPFTGPNLELTLVAQPLTSSGPEKSFVVHATVRNNGHAEVRDAKIQILQPAEFNGVIPKGDTSSGHSGYDDKNNAVVLYADPIAPGGSAFLRLEYSTRNVRNYRFSGQVHVDGRLVEQKQIPFTPTN